MDKAYTQVSWTSRATPWELNVYRQRVQWDSHSGDCYVPPRYSSSISSGTLHPAGVLRSSGQRHIAKR
jgi:hypothetical protein